MAVDTVDKKHEVKGDDIQEDLNNYAIAATHLSSSALANARQSDPTTSRLRQPTTLQWTESNRLANNAHQDWQLPALQQPYNLRLYKIRSTLA